MCKLDLWHSSSWRLVAHGLDGLCGNRHGTAGLGREQPGCACRHCTELTQLTSMAAARRACTDSAKCSRCTANDLPTGATVLVSTLGGRCAVGGREAETGAAAASCCASVLRGLKRPQVNHRGYVRSRSESRCPACAVEAVLLCRVP